ncbi:unnamed protein product [Lupinus luteus]|uniref:S-protein homolog n=1 Tax=Lupinus luteus TaxID=3873 RepID=A0AAV1W480_LUPLU
MKNHLSTIPIVLFLLFTYWDLGMSTPAKIHVYNNQPHEGIYISCSGNKAYEISKVVPPSNEIEIPLPPKKVWPPVECNGKFNEVSSKEHLLYLSMSNHKPNTWKESFYFRVFNNSFYRFDQENKTWVLVPPIIWYP